MNTPVEQLAILLQRAKTLMEVEGSDFQKGFTVFAENRPAGDRTAQLIYRNICRAIDEVENGAEVNAAELRDAEDAATPPRLDGSWAEPREKGVETQ